MRDRPLARLVVAAAILLLGALSAMRLDLAPRAGAAAPQLQVSLSLPDAADPVEVTNRWLVPIESAIRGLGDVSGSRGEAGANGAQLTVRFRRGVDPELKAARLLSDLAPLRRALPRNGALNVWAATGTTPALVLAVDGGNRALEDELRATAGVRDVRIYGSREREIDVRLHPSAPPAPEVATAIASALTTHAAGSLRNGAREATVVEAPRVRNVADVTLANGVRAGALADIRERWSAPETEAHDDGRAVTMVAVFRDDDTPLFRFERAVRSRLDALHLKARVVTSEADDLRAMLIRLAIGAAIASLLLALRGWAWAAYIPLSAALAINVARIADVAIDRNMILAAALAIAAVALVRHALAIPFLVLPPIATSLIGTTLAAHLDSPARAFTITALCALAAQSPLPLRGRGQARSAGQVRAGFSLLPSKLTKLLLRNSASFVLATAAATYLLYAWCGAHLDPRTASAEDRGDLSITLTLPAGTTLAQTRSAAAPIERALHDVEGIDHFRTFLTPGEAWITLQLDDAMERPDRRQVLRAKLRSLIPGATGAVSIGSGGGRRGVALDDDIEQKPEADEKGFVYRVLLKGTDAGALRDAYERLATRVARLDVRRSAIVAEWPASSTRLELVPRATTAADVTQNVTKALAERTLPPREERLADGRVLRVSAYDAPRTRDDVPRLDDVLAQPVGGTTLAAAFDIRRRAVAGRIPRELGRFVMPVTIRVPGTGDQKLKKRDDIDRQLATTALPPGVELLRPSLTAWTFSAAKLRLLGLAAFVPLILFALAVVVLSSFRRALIAIAAPLVALGVTAAVLTMASLDVDEVTLLALIVTVTAVCASSASRVIPSGVTPNHAYRSLRTGSVPLLIASAAALLFLGIAAIGGISMREQLRAPLLVAATMLAAGGVASAFLPAAIAVTAADARRRIAPAARAASHPAEWSDRDAPLVLSVRNVTKIYAGGFRALHRVSFDLRPGIVGLLGPNGAGKTTLLRVMTGLLAATRGQVEWRGVPIAPENLSEYRRRVGFLPQEFNAYAGLTAEQFLDYWCIEAGITSAADRRATVARLITAVQLERDAKRRVRDFSGGMRQRIGIARALIGDPPILIVDEPTTGLDVEARARFRELMLSIARDRIIVLSTHIAGDVETIAQRLLLLSRGGLVWDGNVDALIERARGRVFELIASDADARRLAHEYRLTTRVRVEEGIRVRGIAPEGTNLPGVAADPTLEEAYLAEIGARPSPGGGTFAFVWRHQ